MKTALALGMAGLMSIPLQAFAHGGGLDAQGCHHNRKTGDYHCHRVQAAPPPALTSLAPSASSTRGSDHAPASTGSPACHVGPRGGAYTLTSSGRKNYAGC